MSPKSLIAFNEDDHFDYDQPENNFTIVLSRYASRGTLTPVKVLAEGRLWEL